MVSRWVHWLLYAGILALMVNSGAGEIIFQRRSQTPARLQDVCHYRAHGTMALMLEALFVLHVLAALYHQFIRKDRLFARMGNRGRTSN